MITITATKARESLYALINEVGESHEPVQITGKQGWLLGIVARNLVARNLLFA